MSLKNISDEVKQAVAKVSTFIGRKGHNPACQSRHRERGQMYSYPCDCGLSSAMDALALISRELVNAGNSSPAPDGSGFYVCLNDTSDGPRWMVVTVESGQPAPTAESVPVMAVGKGYDNYGTARAIADNWNWMMFGVLPATVPPTEEQEQQIHELEAYRKTPDGQFMGERGTWNIHSKFYGE